MWQYRYLAAQLVKRDVVGRYRGSLLGLVWSFLHPLFMLLVYLFVFGVVFRIKWGLDTDGGEKSFGVILFSGLVLHAMLAECLVRSPAIIINNTQFVKKVVFPLQVLPLMIVSTAVFHFCIGFILLFVFNTFAHFTIHATVLYAPLVVLPIVMLGLGISWFLASFGVFVRDVGQITGILATVLLFLCPIFYPLEAVPEQLRWVLYFNPLTLIVEQFRGVLIFGRSPDWIPLAIYYVVSLVVLRLGYMWFMRTRKAFADVL
ncbi:MAG: ABC transporter permease [Gammaproteobacteria bacterium]|nr:ABC transporter permease [Gammaproteobacteria bacterium]